MRLIEALPELGDALAPDALKLARHHLVAPAIQLASGRWRVEPDDIPREPGLLGALVVTGVMIRRVQVGASTACELVGSGDLLRPYDEERDIAAVAFGVGWTVLDPARLAILDRRVALVAGRFPEVMEAIIRQAIKRSHSLDLALALSHMRRIEPRLLAMMWHLADRWGRVTTNGIHVPLRLTHQTLAHLVGAQRPSVTTGLKALAEQGALMRRNDGSWILHGEPPDFLGTERAALEDSNAAFE